MVTFSQRRSALVLTVTRKTIKKKFELIAEKSRLLHIEKLIQLKENPVREIQMDDLITIEHTKLKPLSISIVVDKNTRTILGAKVSKIPAFGLLAKKSISKYGKRKNEFHENHNQLIKELAFVIDKFAVIESDKNKQYSISVSNNLPQSKIIQFDSRKASSNGYGELKIRNQRDPLFVINHTCAMFRANINRLARRTWNTTKNVEKLQSHLDIFIHYYNSFLLEKPASTY